MNEKGFGRKRHSCVEKGAGKPGRTAVTITGLWAEIRNQDLLNTKQKGCMSRNESVNGVHFACRWYMRS
jgi:hypothetical protein